MSKAWLMVLIVLTWTCGSTGTANYGQRLIDGLQVIRQQRAVTADEFHIVVEATTHLLPLADDLHRMLQELDATTDPARRKVLATQALAMLQKIDLTLQRMMKTAKSPEASATLTKVIGALDLDGVIRDLSTLLESRYR